MGRRKGRVFCSNGCKRQSDSLAFSFARKLRPSPEERARRLATRRCERCGGPIPQERMVTAKHCSDACARRKEPR